MHALIIEDESLIAMAIEDALRCCGYTSFESCRLGRGGDDGGQAQAPRLDYRRRRTQAGLWNHSGSVDLFRPTDTYSFHHGDPQRGQKDAWVCMIEKPFIARQIVDAIELSSGSRDG